MRYSMKTLLLQSPLSDFGITSRSNEVIIYLVHAECQHSFFTVAIGSAKMPHPLRSGVSFIDHVTSRNALKHSDSSLLLEYEL